MLGLVHGSLMINEEDFAFNRWTQVFILTVECGTNAPWCISPTLQCCWEGCWMCDRHATISPCRFLVLRWELGGVIAWCTCCICQADLAFAFTNATFMSQHATTVSVLSLILFTGLPVMLM